MTEVKVISAKVPPELVETMDKIQKALKIDTRNELIIRALHLYVASYNHAIEKD